MNPCRVVVMIEWINEIKLWECIRTERCQWPLRESTKLLCVNQSPQVNQSVWFNDGKVQVLIIIQIDWTGHHCHDVHSCQRWRFLKPPSKLAVKQASGCRFSNIFCSMFIEIWGMSLKILFNITMTSSFISSHFERSSACQSKGP